MAGTCATLPQELAVLERLFHDARSASRSLVPQSVPSGALSIDAHIGTAVEAVARSGGHLLAPPSGRAFAGNAILNRVETSG